ncbi:DUF6282 family protein [Myxosarcina sp. GI1]|uniref:DUF6282 family protein n=1 Tax=Myxosarcina sp. GI1 TaxID=1541065 RepID=UPI000B009EC8|nr:DUF6282 family protein [Myxosarcina sp. GI1]
MVKRWVKNKLVIIVAIAITIAIGVSNFPAIAIENTSNLSSIQGAIDFHVHSAPDITPRSVDDFELAKMAADEGMKAIVLKNHVTPTADRAILANKIVPNIQLYGGVVLNYAVGGLNPDAVEIMYKIGEGKGKVVWLPTIDADYHRQMFHKQGRGIKVANSGKLLPKTLKILELVAKYDLVLETGHISPEEVELVVEKARELGIKKILITHAIADVPGLSVTQMQQVANMGAFLELTYVNYLMGKNSPIEAHQNWQQVSIADMAAAIKSIGAEHFVLSTDLGRSFDPKPVVGYQKFVTELSAAGISQSEIEMMSQINPSQLLGIK